MQYVYSALWFIMAFMLIFLLGKENKIFYIAGGLFVIFGFWWLFDTIYPQWGLFSGVLGIVFRVIVAAVLIYTCYYYYKLRKNSGDE